MNGIAYESRRDRTLDDVIAQVWGYDTLRPLQREAMEAVLDGRDSVVVMPTGGGKSLCYQAPALVKEGLTVVISPLISLMKDQVDALVSNGVRAAALNSSLSQLEQRAIETEVRDGKLRLLFISPERLVVASTIRLLLDGGVSTFAIDEAHCISHWGHDFRPEYRQIRRLRETFPNASFHAFTATATARVREDIARQLALVDPVVLVGSFDRPNLTYRVTPRGDELAQVEEVIDRHKGEAGIIYCIRRRDVDALSAALRLRGRGVVAYHAGMTPDERRDAQDAFSREECDLVVATVAFGMGIDRSNVRFVIHTGMPKSIEHYQQETGRAGRDGLAAECVLLYAPGDAMTWRSILTGSDAEERSEEFLDSALRQIDEMQRYASGVVCRHRALVEYFGQEYAAESCDACDVCAGGFAIVPDSLQIAQKILSCVYRLREPWGAGHLVSVLRGESRAKIRERGHDRLSTYGILREQPREVLRDWIDQLVSIGALSSSGGAYPTLTLGGEARGILRGESIVALRERVVQTARGGRLSDADDWAGVDRGLFERLRAWRKKEADAREVAPFVIFGDRTLRAVAAARPSSTDRLAGLYGIGRAKLADFGRQLIEIVVDYARETGVSTDTGSSTQRIVPRRKTTSSRSAAREAAFAAFAEGVSIDQVIELTGRARSTVAAYLADFIAETSPASIDPWVSPSLYARIAESATRLGIEHLRPIHDDLQQQVHWDDIRLVVTHMAATAAETA